MSSSMKFDMTSSDLDRQIELLKYYPEIAAKHFKPAIARVVSDVENVIEPMIPIRSGHAADTFGSKVSGRGIESLKGQIGWFDKGDAWYVPIVESGATSHDVSPRGNRITKARAAAGGGATSKLSWPSGYDGGDWVFRSKVSHPGFSGRGFMAAGWSALQPIADSEFAIATQGVFKELEIK